jgi:hypothetical protein
MSTAPGASQCFRTALSRPSGSVRLRDHSETGPFVTTTWHYGHDCPLPSRGLVGRFRVTAGIAWLLWLVVHIAFLTGYKNRLFALAYWAVAFLGREFGSEPLPNSSWRHKATCPR